MQVYEVMLQIQSDIAPFCSYRCC